MLAMRHHLARLFRWFLAILKPYDTEISSCIPSLMVLLCAIGASMILGRLLGNTTVKRIVIRRRQKAYGRFRTDAFFVASSCTAYLGDEGER